MRPLLAASRLIHNSPSLLAAADAVGGVEARQHEFDAACADRFIVAGVDLAFAKLIETIMGAK